MKEGYIKDLYGDSEYNLYDKENIDKHCIEKNIYDILKCEKNILCCMEEVLCKLSAEIDDLDSIQKKVVLYNQLICAYAKKECSVAKIIKSLERLRESYKGDFYNGFCSPFKKC